MKSTMLKTRVEIGGDFDGDPKALVYTFDNEAYKVYEAASTALSLAQTAYDRALGEPVKWPTGSCSFWILNVRLTEAPNEFVAAGTVGDLNVIEVSTDRKVLQAKFYPAGKNGFGLVMWPQFKRLSQDKAFIESIKSDPLVVAAAFLEKHGTNYLPSEVRKAYGDGLSRLLHDYTQQRKP